jgi:glycerophosphoryl diester phosphodiesterase
MASPRPYLAHTPVALAHRGGALYAPNLGLENTLTAFGHAVALGYTHLETDVHVTKDGQLVAFHDTRLDRVGDRAGRLRRLPWEHVQAARLGAGPDHERVPLLREVVDAFPGICLNIDLKAPRTATASRCTSGRSTSGTRCTACSTSASMDSSATGSTC